MSHNSEEVQSKLGEKKQLQKEEEALKKLIEQIQRQISALQVRSFFYFIFRKQHIYSLRLRTWRLAADFPWPGSLLSRPRFPVLLHSSQRTSSLRSTWIYLGDSLFIMER